MTAVRASAGHTHNAATSFTEPVPAGVLGGDLILVFVDWTNTTPVMSGDPTSAGYTLLDTQTSTTMTSKVYWKRAAGAQGAASSDAGTTLTWTFSSGTPIAEAHVVVLSGATLTNPSILGYGKSSDTGGGITHNSPAATFAGSNKAVIEHMADKGTTQNTLWTPPAGFTKLVDTYHGTTGTCTAITAVKTADNASSPAGGDTYTEAVAEVQVVGWTIAIDPAVTDQPPTVSITAPADNATVSGTIGITATAADDAGVASVAFKVDGSAISTDMSSPFAASLDTTTLTNAAHTLTAIATDTATQTTTSATIHITVNNIVSIYSGVTTGSVGDAKRACFAANKAGVTGGSAVGSTTDLEFAFYSNNSGLSNPASHSMKEHKIAFFASKGYSDEISYMKSRGAVGSSNSSVRLDFYRNRSFV